MSENRPRPPRPPSAQEKKDATKERRQTLLNNTTRLLADIDAVFDEQLTERLNGYAEVDLRSLMEGE